MKAPAAETAGIREEKKFVLATPRTLMELTKNTKARTEHNAARASMGYINFIDRILSKEKSLPL